MRGQDCRNCVRRTRWQGPYSKSVRVTSRVGTAVTSKTAARIESAKLKVAMREFMPAEKFQSRSELGGA